MGKVFLQAYGQGNLFRSPGIEYFNGPFYFMVFTLTSQLFHTLNPGWLLTDGLHLTNFLTFLGGVFFFHRVALRLLPRGLALFVTALFATQPVLFGHAFINQKDTPLMAFFLASVELGWMAVDSRRSIEQSRPSDRKGQAGPAEMVGPREQLSRARRSLMWGGGLLGLIVLLDLWWVGTIQAGARVLLGEIYVGRGPAILVDLFGRIAEDSYKTPLSAYMTKLDSLYSWARLAASLLSVAGASAVWKLTFPRSYANVVVEGRRRWGLVVIAGCVLGMATSIRVLAPFAGALVAAYWIGGSGRRAVPGLVVYGVIAVVATYLTWPVLWGDPFVGLADWASEFHFTGYTVYLWGSPYRSGDLPWNYLPALLGVQLTLPAVFLLLTGTPYSWILSAKDRVRRQLMALVWLWLLLPSAAVILRLAPIYHNFRHILFAVPPIFLIMGFGAWKTAEVLRAPALRTALALVGLAPGILGIVRLHPYEYIYYNELVGGVRGAEGKFGLDYWCTSFREGMTFVNQAAEVGDRVAFARLDVRSATPFAREDLLLVGESEASDADFALKCRIGIGQPTLFFPDMETIYEVRADGVLLTVVKQPVQEP
jgi:hypothetical protein